MASITLDALRKEFADVVAVDDVELTLEDGEFLVLLGPSGCGKSTTLRMIAGLEEPTGGDLRVGSESVVAKPPAARNFAMVFQQIALYPHMSVRDNISSPLRADGIDTAAIDRQVEETARTLDIESLLDRRPGELSGGQQQRVAIGRALVREPEAFLLDEPFSKLDQKLRTQLQTELTRLQEEMGVTTVFVTHNQEEAMVLADRIAIMNDGSLEQVGTPSEVYEHPANRFVADFIGNPTMNFFDASLSEGTLSVADTTLDGVPVEGSPEVAELAARPEDLALVEEGGSFEATLEFVEMRGSTRYLICTNDAGEELTVRYDGDASVTEGERYAFAFDFGGVDLFAVDGERVSADLEAALATHST